MGQKRRDKARHAVIKIGRRVQHANADQFGAVFTFDITHDSIAQLMRVLPRLQRFQERN
ncbi:MAG: hypothetical protein WB495_02025 [Xanthobacteraceae bacterium]